MIFGFKIREFFNTFFNKFEKVWFSFDGYG